MDCISLQVKKFVLDHALKHNISSVLKRLLKDSSIVKYITDAVNAQKFSVPLFMILLRLLKNSLTHAENAVMDKHFPYNRSLHRYATSLLISTYRQYSYMASEDFFRLISTLKRMELIICIFSDDVNQPNVIGEQINSLCPPWSASLEAELKELFKMDRRRLNKEKERHNKFRRFVLCLTVNPSVRNRYQNGDFQQYMAKYIKKSCDYLQTIIDDLTSKMRESAVEKIMRLAAEDRTFSINPAVQIILEYVQLDMKENDFLNLLQSLEPDAELKAEDNMTDTQDSELESEIDPSEVVESVYSRSSYDEDTTPAKKPRRMTVSPNVTVVSIPAGGTGSFVVECDNNSSEI